MPVTIKYIPRVFGGTIILTSGSTTPQTLSPVTFVQGRSGQVKVLGRSGQVQVQGRSGQVTVSSR